MRAEGLDFGDKKIGERDGNVLLLKEAEDKRPNRFWIVLSESVYIMICELIGDTNRVDKTAKVSAVVEER
ncbi:hypothetical protein RCL_jg26681.t1 [Rhizophagus clarus]|uniref:Uncharacterized protein n=1 Tax=Rhizophagus clarus TaxID=94130 RepID=A0A8H3R043_9GLOM|nr:hypothetical protein RCL_jg26681.t1 [Rhizophagus clarus]